VAKLLITAVVALTALACAVAPGAFAATPFTAGSGGGVHLAASTDGAGHVAWVTPARGADPAKVGYCHIPPGGNTCDVTKTFDFPAAPGQTAQADPSKITIHTPRALEVRIFAACQMCGDGSAVDHVYTWGSTTNGSVWSDQFLLGTTPTSTGLQPDAAWILDSNTFVSPGEGVETLVFQTAGAVATHFPVVSDGFVYNPSTVRVPVTSGDLPQLLQASSNLGSIQYASFRAGNLNAATIAQTINWNTNRSIAGLEPDSAEPHLSTGPANVYMTYRRSVPGDNQILVRRFGSDSRTFSSSTPIQGDDPIDNSADGPSSAQDSAGRIHVIWSSGHDTGRLRYTRSNDSGTDWSAPLNVAQGEAFNDAVVVGDEGGSGWAAWANAGGEVRVVRLEPYAERTVTPPPPTCTPPATGTPPNCKTPTTPTATVTRKTVAVKGASITFSVPKACVAKGKTFKVTLSWKKRKRKGNLFVKVSRADFYIGKKRVKIDRHAPFTQTLTVNTSAAAGSKLTVRARAYIKVKRGKSPKKSVSSSISVCA
jgi:hypothetical protein